MNSACRVRQLNAGDVNEWVALRREALENHPLVFGASVPANFIEWGRQPRALSWQGEYTDAIHMMLHLKEPRIHLDG